MATFELEFDFDEIPFDLCWNTEKLKESELILRLKAMRIDPEALATTDERGFTFLHYAATASRSPEFLKVLHGLDPSLVKTRDNHGRLPVHLACSLNNIDAAKYLLEIYPESIKIATSTENGQQYPLHLFLKNLREGCISIEEAEKFLEFLLKFDAGALSTPNGYGDLPLHYATRLYSMHLVKLLFNAYPEGIFIKSRNGNTPLDCASFCNKRAASFLKSQVKLVNQAINVPLSMHQLAFRLGTVPVSLGAIKLAVKDNPAVTTVTDINGCTLLHLACQKGFLDIAKYLIEFDKDSLKKTDAKGNLALHHACLGGWYDIVIDILGESSYGVTVRNSDKDKKLPIELLLYEAKCDRNSLRFAAAVDLLLRSCPDTLLDLTRSAASGK